MALPHLLPLPGEDEREAAIRACRVLRPFAQDELLPQRHDRVRDYLLLAGELRKRGIISGQC